MNVSFIICCLYSTDNESDILTQQPLVLNAYMNAKHIFVNSIVDRRRQTDYALRGNAKQRHIFSTVPSFHVAFNILINVETVMTVPLHLARKYVKNSIYQYARCH